MATECGGRVYLFAAAGTAGYRGDSVGEARSADPFHVVQHVAGLELGHRELLVANCVCVQRVGACFSDEPGSARSAENAAGK